MAGGIRPGAALGRRRLRHHGRPRRHPRAAAGPAARPAAPDRGGRRLRRVGLLVGQYATGGGWRPVVRDRRSSRPSPPCSARSTRRCRWARCSCSSTPRWPPGLVTPLPRGGGARRSSSPAPRGPRSPTLVQAWTEPLDPDRTAVAAVFSRIADLLDGLGHRPRRRRAPRADRRRSTRPTTGSSAAAATPPAAAGSSPSWPGCSTPPRRWSRAPSPPPAPACRPTRATSPPSGRSPRRSSGDRELPGERPARAGGAAPAPRRAVRHGVRLVWNVVGDPEERAGAAAPRPELDRRARLRELVDRTLASAESRAFAVRLALCMTHRRDRPAERADRSGPTGCCSPSRSCSSPTSARCSPGRCSAAPARCSASCSARRCSRSFPRSPWLLLAMAASPPSLPWARDANFGLFSVFQTPLIILLLDLTAARRRRPRRRPARRHPASAARSCSCSATCCGRRPGGRRWTRRCATPRWRSTRSSRRRSPAARPSAAAPAGATTGRSPSCRPSCSAGWPSRRRSAPAPPPGGR